MTEIMDAEADQMCGEGNSRNGHRECKLPRGRADELPEGGQGARGGGRRDVRHRHRHHRQEGAEDRPEDGNRQASQGLLDGRGGQGPGRRRRGAAREGSRKRQDALPVA